VETIQIQLDQETIERVRQLAQERQTTPEEVIRDLVQQAEAKQSVRTTASSEAVDDPLWGSFADDAEILDQIVEEAMQARERRWLPPSDGKGTA
jgi:predicted transcriptional regulator